MSYYKYFLLFIILTCTRIYSQSFYEYNNEKVALYPLPKANKCYVQYNNKEAFIERLLRNSNVERIKEISNKGAIIDTRGKFVDTLCYISDIYETAWGGEIIVNPRLILKLKKDCSIESIATKYSNIIELDTCTNGLFRWNCKLNTSSEVLSLSSEINHYDEVEWCEPVKTSRIFFSNSLFPEQYYLKNEGQTGGTAGIDINVQPAWNITKGESNIKVAVIDDGVDLLHEDFDGNILQGYTVNNPSGYGAPQCADNSDAKGHGTACAGIIAARDNSIGIIGVASGAKLLPVNIVPYFFGFASDEDIADAIRWAYQRADILSCSWYSYSFSNNIASAISDALTLGRDGKGTSVVFCSGNNYSNPNTFIFPANLGGVITVGAVDKDGIIWGYSCRGDSLDLVAPSGDINGHGDIVTTDRSGTDGYSNNNYTDSFGGTSAACPQVAGVAALLLSIRPDLTAGEVKNVLCSTARKLNGETTWTPTYGYGLVDAYAALQAVNLTPTIEGETVLCSQEVYEIDDLPTGFTITWSIDNNDFSITPSGYNCTVTCVQGVTTKQAVLTATISRNGTNIKQISKSIICHGTSLELSGTQETYHGIDGYYPEQSISNDSVTGHAGTANDMIPVNGECTIHLISDRFIGMDISFESDYLPTDFSHNGDEVTFTTEECPVSLTRDFPIGGPMKSFPYTLKMVAEREGGCSDFDLYFNVSGIPYLNDTELLISVTNNILYVELLSAEATPIGEGQYQQPTWNLRIVNAASGLQVFTSNVVGSGTNVNISGFAPGLYVVQATYNGNTYSGKFRKQI